MRSGNDIVKKIFFSFSFFILLSIISQLWGTATALHSRLYVHDWHTLPFQFPFHAPQLRSFSTEVAASKNKSSRLVEFVRLPTAKLFNVALQLLEYRTLCTAIASNWFATNSGLVKPTTKRLLVAFEWLGVANFCFVFKYLEEYVHRYLIKKVK